MSMAQQAYIRTILYAVSHSFLGNSAGSYQLQVRRDQAESTKMKLKVYADRMSQPSRAVLIFCKVNGIEFEEVKLDIAKKQNLTTEFEEINPLKKLPSITDGRFKLSESHAILIYLASLFPGVPDHWYPNDIYKRAKIHSVLDWHHCNLRTGTVPLVQNAALNPAMGLPLNLQAAARAEKIASSSLSTLESVWLTGGGKFLLDQNQPSIADLLLVCDIIQVEVLDEKDKTRILGPHKKVQQWIEDTRYAMRPHFDEVHNILFRAKAKLQKQRSLTAKSEAESSLETALKSKM